MPARPTARGLAPSRAAANCARCWSKRRGALSCTILTGTRSSTVWSLRWAQARPLARLPVSSWWSSGHPGHVLTKQLADGHADRPLVTRKLQRWGKHQRLAHQHGLSRSAFARQHLRRLGLDPLLAGLADGPPGGETPPALRPGGPLHATPH